MFKSDDEDNLNNLSPSHINPKITELSKICDIGELYDVKEQLGYGAYGIVYRVIDLKTKEIKSLKIRAKCRQLYRHFQEITILFKIKHPNIIMLEKAFEMSKHICLVFEYCPRDLSKVLANRKFLQEFEVHQISQYLVSAVAYLHMNSIVHRDLKIENILLANNPEDATDQWFIKLIDFGLSAIRLKSDSKHKLMLDEFCGTPNYMAPELSTKSYSQQCDVWSIGIILYLLLRGSYPYTFDSQMSKLEDFEIVKKLITNSTVDYKSLNCSNQAIELIKRCLNVNPAMRITAGEMLNDPWILGHRNTRPNRNTNILLLMDEFNKNIRHDRHGQSQNNCENKEKTNEIEKLEPNPKVSLIKPNFQLDNSRNDLYVHPIQMPDLNQLLLNVKAYDELPKITILSSRHNSNIK